MMKFQVHSPGKVILHGEHAVIYQKPALAAVVGLGTTLQFRSVADSQMAIFQLKSLNSTLEIKLSNFNAFLDSFRSKYPGDKLESTAKLLEEVRAELAKEMERNMGTPKAQNQRALVSIFYLLAGAVLTSPIEPNLKLSQGFQVQVDSELNVGAGLGSSASYGSALAAAFLILAGHFDEKSYLQEENLALISHWAYESERVNHGTPSGVDNTVCTYGGILRFVKGQGFQPLRVQKPLNILLVDSRVGRSTADIVAKVRHLSEEFPLLIDAIWEACEQLVNSAVPLYESFGNGQDDSEKFEKLERLFQINNDLLKAIGVTHPKLEQIFTIAFKRGFFSKMTGAGAGGYAIVLLPEKYECNEVYWKLKAELEVAGFGVHVTTAGGDGLRVSSLDN
ncbi:PREDICTED: mevalonate kinase [Drosophila arizonae]|uniref:Mevalonate kinase n=1 Tax=Drosophila arizonae TaxID=7263 RepID=A0ABM1PEX6_DROAR|nr:PREDICTED: mevalonate kinase [Drosophila arizonae]